MKVLFSIFQIAFAINLIAQQTFMKTYDGVDHFYDSGWDLLLNQKKGYYFTTGSFCNSNDESCTHFYKLDSIGQVVWKTTLSNSEIVRKTGLRNLLIETKQKNIFFGAGQLFPDSIDNGRAFTWKATSEGEILWGKEFNAPNVDFSRARVELPSGNIVCLAEGNPASDSQNNPNMPWELSLFAINQDGEPLWYKPYLPTPYLHVPDSHSLILTKSNELITAFNHTSPEIPWNKQMGLAKFDTLGNEIWTRFFEHKFNETGEVHERGDGKYITWAQRDTGMLPSGYHVALSIYCYDTSGQRVWEKANWISDNDNSIWDLAILPDGDMAAVGSFYVKPQKNWLAWLVRMDSAGNVKWERFFDNKYPWNQHGRLDFTDIEGLPDGRLAILGDKIDTIPDTGNYEWNAMLLVLDSLGHLNGSGDTTLLNTTTTSIQSIPINSQILLLAPNPANEVIEVTIQGWQPNSKHTISLQSLLGQTLVSYPVNGPTAILSTQLIPSGLYFVQLLDARDSILSTQKIIICH